MKEFTPDSFPCANCGGASVTLFEQVPVCGTCNTVVQHKVEAMQRSLDQKMVLYREALRVQLIEARIPKK